MENTQEIGANSVDTEALETPVTTQGNETVETTPATEVKKEEVGTTYSQKQFDDSMAKTRGATEREVTRKLLEKLGLKPGEEDKLAVFKQAYQDSLSEEEKRNQIIDELQADNLRLMQDLEEKEYTIKALIKMTGKNEDDVEKIVRMAKGLKTDENTIEDAIGEVIEMVKPKDAPTTVIPTGKELEQPSTTVAVDTTVNPFKQGSVNLTEQGKLVRENPELAKKLAAEAGVTLNI